MDYSINSSNAKARSESKTNIRGVYFRKARPGIAKASWICEWSDKEGRHSKSEKERKYCYKTGKKISKVHRNGF